jgi:pyruvate dehydrogenase E2 component (dihydrolipoamide acetyltransferase)
MPQFDETVPHGSVVRWLKREGDWVEAAEPLLRVSTDMFDTEVPSPADGILREITVAEDDTVAAGTPLAIIERSERSDSKGPASSAERREEFPYVTPLVRALAAEHGVDLATVAGTGIGGRIRKQDVVLAVRARRNEDKVPVCMPQFGENGLQVTVLRWLKREGDRVEAKQPLLEVSTDYFDTEVPSLADGILCEVTVAEEDTVAAGTQLAIVEIERSERSDRTGL